MSTKRRIAEEGTPAKSAPDSQPGTGTPAARLGRTRTSPAFAAETVARDVWSQANGFYAVAFNLRCSGVIWVVKIFFVQFFCVFCHLFLISSASVRSIPFLSFIVPIFA